jgi:3-hydroxyacyl-CoA dehydrogenase/enoyl-CoA hydratase/3-hydroxybutyryl-CoA epimerase
MSRTGGHYPAPLEILEVLRNGLGAPLEKAFELEARAAGELIATDVSKNLIHVFQMREAARKGTGVEGDAEPLEVETVGVLGAGTMGGGIAQLVAYNGLRVRMKDIEHQAVADGLSHARRLFDKAVEKHKLSRREADRKMELVSGGVSYDGFGRADLVVEAVVERMDVKRSVLAEVEERVRDECVLATNTSSLSVDEMAEALERPGNLGGMHFFNPVHKMPLVEVVRGAHTSDRTVATVYRLALELGKTPVVVKDGPGFLVNRILGPYLNEAGWLLADGASVEAVDEAASEFGMPMGPLRLVDEIGIDVARHAGETLHRAFGDRLEPAPPLTAVGETDRLGKKGGLGFYRYENGKEKAVDPEIYRALGDAVPPARRSMERSRVRARLVVAMLNEAARALEAGLVRSAGELDLAMIMGTGFPPFRGGLLRYADHLHPRTVLDRSRELARDLGPRFEPPELLERLAREDRGFYEEFGGG